MMSTTTDTRYAPADTRYAPAPLVTPYTLRTWSARRAFAIWS